MVVLYTIHCPKCDILKTKLDAKKIKYTLIDDVSWLIENGFDKFPVLEVDGKRYDSLIDINKILENM